MGNGEWGMGNGERGTGNGERGTGNGERRGRGFQPLLSRGLAFLWAGDGFRIVAR